MCLPLSDAGDKDRGSGVAQQELGGKSYHVKNRGHGLLSMTTSDAGLLSSYELPLPAAETVSVGTEKKKTSLPEFMLVKNAFWFCRLRWIAIAILVVFGLSGLFTDRVAPFDLLLRSDWPLVMAGILSVANLTFIWHARSLVRSGARQGASLNIWSQMILDLVAHTFVVHFLGILETYALFVYLFHIVLSCVFFSRAQSLVVAVIACALLATCFGLEAAGLVSPTSVYADAWGGEHLDRIASASVLNVASAMVIWLVVWYMASYLGALVRERGVELAETNRRLVEAQEEKDRHLLRTTHELKAPFAAIHANAQLLLKDHCGPFTEEAREVLLRISARCRHLAREIQQMLQLANLRSASQESQRPADLSLDGVIRRSLERIRQVAEERKVTVEEDLSSVRVSFVREHLRVLLDNLLSNAVAYSHEGGLMRVECDRPADGGPTITIEDHGIGIPPDKLPRIFDEYYRTNEAARFNKGSTGLGLTIVKHIAQMHRVRVRVESRAGVGTKFILRLPPGLAGRRAEEMKREKEVTYGLRGDH